MAFWKVCFLMGQLIGLGVAKTDGPVLPVELREFEEIRQKAACPDDNYKVFSKSCYKVFPDLKTWTEAEARCRKDETKMGQGHLVSILNQQENDFVVDLWCATNPPECSNKPWIGLRDTNDNDNNGLIWSDAEPFDYSSFKCQPNTNPNNSCVSLRRRGFWKTNLCERKMPYICKVPAVNP